MKTKAVIAGYAEGLMYPGVPNQLSYEEVKKAGWTNIILCLYHIDQAGNISFNDKRIVQDGTYTGSLYWPGMIGGLKNGGSINTISASIGGEGVSDFRNIQAIYEENTNSFTDTQLEKNFQTFRKTFPAIDIIDMACEDYYDPLSFVAFCKMLIDMGFGISFCLYNNPWTFPHFWTSSLAQLENYKPGVVKWWNLQCYNGGAGNTPQQWAKAINKLIPDFNTTEFIIAGDWSIIPNLCGDSPEQVSELFQNFGSQSSLGGGFIWTIDNIVLNREETSSACGKNVAMKDYVNAIADVFNYTEVKIVEKVSWK